MTSQEDTDDFGNDWTFTARQEDIDDFGSVYTDGKGARMTCPNCGSSDISASEWEADGQAASCIVSCDDEDCGWRWKEYYTAKYWNKIL